MESLEREKGSAHSAEATFRNQLFAEEKKSLSLEAVAKEAQTSLEETRKRMEDLANEIERLQQEVVAAKSIPPPPQSPPEGAFEDSDIVVSLRADISRLQNENGDLLQKSNTIEERYRSGNLVGSPFATPHAL